MQTANFQLSLAVKPSSANSPSGLASSSLGQGANADGFANWMREASNRPAQFDRAESKSLPQEGSSLPSESRSDSASRSESAQDAQDVESKGPKGEEVGVKDDHSDDNPSQKSHSDKDDVGSSPKSDKQDVKPEDAVNASSSDSTEKRAADASLEADSQGDAATTNDVVSEDGAEALSSALAASQVVVEEVAGTEDGINGPVPKGVETPEQTDSELARPANREGGAGLVDLAGKPGEGRLADLAAQTSAQVTTPKEVEVESVDVRTASLNTEVDTPVEIVKEVVTAEDGQGESVDVRAVSLSAEVSPPVAVAEGGVLTEEGQVESVDTLSASISAEVAKGVLTAEPKELTDTQQSNSEVPLAKEPALDGELPNTAVSGVGAEGKAGVSDAEPIATQLNSSDELVQVQVVDELDQKAQVESVGSAESIALGGVTTEATRSTESRPINQPTAAASADRVETQIQPQTSNSGGQQAGADSQNGRQSLMQQSAQAPTGDDGSKGAAAEAQSSLAKTSPSAALAADAPGRLVSATAQASVSTAVPPQALNRMQQANWGQKLGERSLMMVQHGPRIAFVQLDPPELGALQVRVHLQHGDQVSLNITAPNAAVKEVLEQHLPRLREMFAEQGLNLSQSDVRDQSAGQRDRNESGESGDRGRYTDQAEETTPAMMEMDVPVGMVDYYA